MQVTSISLTKNKKRYNIFVDEQFALSIGPNILTKHNIYKGKSVSEKELVDLKNKDFEDRYYQKILSLILRRPRSEFEIIQYLRRKLEDNFDARKIHKIIRKLKKQKHIDDKKFAKWWINNRKSFKPRGKHAIISELKRKRVSNSIIKEAFEESRFSTKIETKLAKKILGKRLKSKDIKKLSFNEINKLKAFLARKGFSFDIINKILKK